MAPVVVLTDQESMLHVRPHTSLPVALVRRAVGTEPGFPVGAAHVSPPGDDPGRQSAIRERLEEFGAAVDLCEPFERIRAAIDEAQRH